MTYFCFNLYFFHIVLILFFLLGGGGRVGRGWGRVDKRRDMTLNIKKIVYKGFET